MTIKKTLLALSTIFLLAFNAPVVEATGTASATAAKSASTKAKRTTKKRAKGAAAAATGLQAFNQNVKITLVRRATAVQNNQRVAMLVYEVTNRGRNNIKAVNWSSAFTLNNEIFFIHEGINPKFEKPLRANQKETVTLTLLLDRLPANVRPVFEKNDIPIGHRTVARQIDFTNGKKIVVTD